LERVKSMPAGKLWQANYFRETVDGAVEKMQKEGGGEAHKTEREVRGKR